MALPRSVKHWSLTTLREKLIKIGAKVVRHSGYVIFQMAEVAVPRELFAAILDRIARIGEPAMDPGNARVARDVVPFAMTDFEGRIAGLNRVGLRRDEFPADHIKEIRDAYRLLFNPISGIMPDFIKCAEQLTSPPVRRLVQFVSRPSKRGIAGRARRSSSRLEFRGHTE